MNSPTSKIFEGRPFQTSLSLSSSALIPGATSVPGISFSSCNIWAMERVATLAGSRGRKKRETEYTFWKFNLPALIVSHRKQYLQSRQARPKSSPEECLPSAPISSYLRKRAHCWMPLEGELLVPVQVLTLAIPTYFPSIPSPSQG